MISVLFTREQRFEQSIFSQQEQSDYCQKLTIIFIINLYEIKELNVCLSKSSHSSHNDSSHVQRPIKFIVFRLLRSQLSVLIDSELLKKDLKWSNRRQLFYGEALFLYLS